MHNTDLTEKTECGKNYGLKINYALLLRMENLIEETLNCFEKKEGCSEKEYVVKSRKKSVVLGGEYIYAFKDHDYLNTLTGKVMVLFMS